MSAFAGSNGLLFVRKITDLVRMTYRRMTSTISLDSGDKTSQLVAILRSLLHTRRFTTCPAELGLCTALYGKAV